MEVYIVGCKGIPARYGGFETFVDQLTHDRQDEQVHYHVAVMNGDAPSYSVGDTHCFGVRVPMNIGPSKAVVYDLRALSRVCGLIRESHGQPSIVYILACRIGPFFAHYVKKLHRMGACVVINPDGHEWLRAKWNALIRGYWKISERLMVKHADRIVCDSREIQKYIDTEYDAFQPKTEYIAYGASLRPPKGQEDEYREWCRNHQVLQGEYYLVVGRFVPENNLEYILKEFIASDTQRKLIVITNAEKNQYYQKLLTETQFLSDSRIRFAGTVYQPELLRRIRAGAFAYFHGHEVGGTNPSLLEALASTALNLVFDVVYNREVCEDAALYFTKEPGVLRALMKQAEAMPPEERERLEKMAKERIRTAYLPGYIAAQYEALWRKLCKG